MTIQQFSLQGTIELEKVGIETARLDCLILLADLVGKDKSWLLAHLDFELNEKQEAQYVAMIEQRKQHVPIAYIIGRSEFYGLSFLVTSDTLQPRPETEVMIELITKLPKKRNRVLVDIGTGTGCIAIAAKCDSPDLDIYATDLSAPALKIAKKNADAHKTTITFSQGNLLEPIIEVTRERKISEMILCANLPYVPDMYPINRAAKHEPSLALFGGADGLDIYRELFLQIQSFQNQNIPIHLLTESLSDQHLTLEALAQTYGFTTITKSGLIHHFYSNL